jgi:hypothetical protein
VTVFNLSCISLFKSHLCGTAIKLKKKLAAPSIMYFYGKYPLIHGIEFRTVTVGFQNKKLYLCFIKQAQAFKNNSNPIKFLKDKIDSAYFYLSNLIELNSGNSIM